MPLISNFRYRPEIDGLRAIAVLAVVMYHAGLGVAGGYIGVDVFFVVSGFLITSLILKDLQEDKFTLAHFWERRARRIIPAAVVVVLATLIAGWFLLLPSDYAKLGSSAAWQAVFGANFHFWLNNNYFGGSAEEQPLLHTWSLAVEEQFYLFFPLILFSLFRIPLFRRRGGLLALFACGFVTSLAASIYAVPRMPAAAFYLLPTRAWELLCGAIVAILPVASLRRGWREAFCWAALAAILAPCFLYTKETPFPGLAALPPCLGTALFIWASGSAPHAIQHSKFNIQNFLSSRPLVFIGLVSYSFYLWHWPFFAFSHYWALEPLSLGYRLTLVAASLALAILSWRFVETPFRKRKLGIRRKAMFLYAGGGLGMAFAWSAMIMTGAGFGHRFSNRACAFDAAKSEAFVENRLTKTIYVRDALAGRFPRLGESKSGDVRVFVWGDSHALSILPAADQLARNRGEALHCAWCADTPPVLGYEVHGKYALGNDGPRFNQAVVDYIERHQIPNVLMVARWSMYFKGEPMNACRVEDNRFAAALLETVKRLCERNCTPWLLMEVPNHGISVPKALLCREILGSDIGSYACTQEKLASRDLAMATLRPLLEAAGAKILDASTRFYDPPSGYYMMERENSALYYDSHHLTKAGAWLASPALEPIFLRR